MNISFLGKAFLVLFLFCVGPAYANDAAKEAAKVMLEEAAGPAGKFELCNLKRYLTLSWRASRVVGLGRYLWDVYRDALTEYGRARKRPIGNVGADYVLSMFGRFSPREFVEQLKSGAYKFLDKEGPQAEKIDALIVRNEELEKELWKVESLQTAEEQANSILFWREMMDGEDTNRAVQSEAARMIAVYEQRSPVLSGVREERLEPLIARAAELQAEFLAIFRDPSMRDFNLEGNFTNQQEKDTAVAALKQQVQIYREGLRRLDMFFSSRIRIYDSIERFY